MTDDQLPAELEIDRFIPLEEQQIPSEMFKETLVKLALAKTPILKIEELKERRDLLKKELIKGHLAIEDYNTEIKKIYEDIKQSETKIRQLFSKVNLPIIKYYEQLMIIDQLFVQLEEFQESSKISHQTFKLVVIELGEKQSSLLQALKEHENQIYYMKFSIQSQLDSLKSKEKKLVKPFKVDKYAKTLQEKQKKLKLTLLELTFYQAYVSNLNRI